MPITQNEINVNNLVYVGDSSHLNGLTLFITSIENSIKLLKNTHSNVTFLGMFSDIDSTPFNDWIHLYTAHWKSNGIDVTIIEADEDEIVSFLGKPGMLAVLPSLFDGVSRLGYRLLNSGIPFIASDKTAVSSQLPKDYIFQSNIDGLTRIFSEIVGRPCI